MKRWLVLPLLLVLCAPVACTTNAQNRGEESISKPKPDPEFMELFDMEIQNRAFALQSGEGALERDMPPEEKKWFEAWVDFERFNQRRYAPTAKKYGLSQEARKGAKIQAGLSRLAAAVVPDDVTMKFMLSETVKYLEKLKRLEQVAPSEDRAFFAYVVEQEELQIEVLTMRVEGKTQESAERLRAFVAKHSKSD